MPAILGPDGKPYQFGYDAVAGKTQRKLPVRSLMSEDRELRGNRRSLMVSSARDLSRNFAVAAWAIRRHLDYVTSFSFESRTGNEKVDDAIEAWMKLYSRAQNCDAMKRDPLWRMVRIAEGRRIADGDVFVLKLSDGRVQGIEGDRIEKAGNLPAALKDKNIVRGVVLDGNSVPESYIICKRTERINGLEYERLVSADDMLAHGYYDRFDQIRGVSPLAPAINTFRDCYEGMDYALAKMKVAQLFALAIYRDGAEPLPGMEAQTDVDDAYSVDFSRGPVMLDLKPGDKAAFLESTAPGQAFADYMECVIACALKSLDIPISSYDEGHTNFSGSRVALVQYERSAESKRAEVRQLLDSITQHALSAAKASGDIPKLPKLYEPEAQQWEWVSRGTPWLQPLQEVKADVMAIEAGLDSRTRIVKERTGRDFMDVVKELKAEKEAMIAANLSEAAVAEAIATPISDTAEDTPNA